MNYSVIKFILTIALCYSCNLTQAITKNIKVEEYNHEELGSDANISIPGNVLTDSI